jgi:hypothetical protein
MNIDIRHLQAPFRAIQNGVSVDDVIFTGMHGLPPLPRREERKNAYLSQDEYGTYTYLVAGLYPKLKELLEYAFEQARIPIDLNGYNQRRVSDLCISFVSILQSERPDEKMPQLRRTFRNDIMDNAVLHTFQVPGFEIDAEAICLTDTNGQLFIHYINFVHRF